MEVGVEFSLRFKGLVRLQKKYSCVNFSVIADHLKQCAFNSCGVSIVYFSIAFSVALCNCELIRVTMEFYICVRGYEGEGNV